METYGIDLGPNNDISTLNTQESIVANNTTEQYSFNTDQNESLLSNQQPINNKDTKQELNDDSNVKGDSNSASINENDISDISKVALDIDTKVKASDKTLQALKADLNTRGIDLNRAIKEYNEYGALSTQTIADLGNAGYPKEIIDSFIQSRQVLEEQFTNAVLKEAGGEAEFNRIQQWASNNLTPKQAKAFNKALDSNDLETISLMMSGIKSKMVSRMGTRNQSLIGGSSNVTPNKGFKGRDGVIKAMSDPRYGRDPSYTREVEEKMLYTSF